jgi:ubiquinone/menaquinone biosynthesis C-methylase UbiE
MPAGQISELYRERSFTDGYPDLEQLGIEWFSRNQHDSSIGLESKLRCIGRMIDLEHGLKTVCEIGCGPKPIALICLKEHGFTTVGIEPIAAFVKAGCEMLDDPKGVLQGRAEQVPLPDESQRVVLLESVLEHVDSPRQALGESYRILAPDGVLFVYTTNRHRISLTGKNGEFRIPFYNFFPDIVKESYVFDHLHYNPTLANYSPLPAVHWFCFSDLCRLGRDAGFAKFYSALDLTEANDSFVASGIRHLIFKFVRRSPLLRSLALLQFGNGIFMWKPKKTGE